MPCIKQKSPKIMPAFTNTFFEMINIIHLDICLNEIKFLSEILGLKLLNIQLSNSNKKEDLLGKVIFDKDKETNATVIKSNETDLMNILKNKTDDKYLIYLMIYKILVML